MSFADMVAEPADPAGGPLAGQFARFLVAGLASTAGSYLVFVLLLQLMHRQAAYALAFLSGLLIGYGLNATWTFRSRHSMLRLGLYPLAYLPQLGLGAALLEVLVAGLGLPAELAVLFVIAASVPVNFLIMRLIFRRTGGVRQQG